MKKIVLMLLCLVFLVGCSSDQDEMDKITLVYESMQKQLEAQTEFKDSSPYFTLTPHVDAKNKVVSIALSDVKIEMYNVQALVLDKSIVHNQGVWPQFNILQPVDRANFIPNQSEPGRGVYDGFNIAFESTSDSVVILVKWHNRSNTQTQTEYLRVNINEVETPSAD